MSFEQLSKALKATANQPAGAFHTFSKTGDTLEGRWSGTWVEHEREYAAVTTADGTRVPFYLNTTLRDLKRIPAGLDVDLTITFEGWGVGFTSGHQFRKFDIKYRTATWTAIQDAGSRQQLMFDTVKKITPCRICWRLGLELYHQPMGHGVGAQCVPCNSKTPIPGITWFKTEQPRPSRFSWHSWAEHREIVGTWRGRKVVQKTGTPFAVIETPAGEIKGVPLSSDLDGLTQHLKDGDVVTLTPNTATLAEVAR